MKHFPGLFLSSFLLASVGVPHAFANQITFYNTGVAADGSLLASGSIDVHYSLLNSPEGDSTAIAMTPNGAWTRSASAGYIGPTSDGNQGLPAGYYIYEAVLNLTGYEAATASLSGVISADDEVSIYLNRNSSALVFAGGGFNSYSRFTINSGFVDGVNLVDFVVHNDGGPTGFSVDHTFATALTPEPQAFFLLATGLVGGACGLANKKRVHVPQQRKSLPAGPPQ